MTIYIYQSNTRVFAFSAKALKDWIKDMRTQYGKAVKPKSGSAAIARTPRQKWLHDSFDFLKDHIIPKYETRQLGQASVNITLSFPVNVDMYMNTI